MRSIPWVEIIEQEDNVVINRYPFPDVEDAIDNITLDKLIEAIDNIKHHITKQCNENRLHFILNRWHTNKYVRVVYADWKYR